MGEPARPEQRGHRPLATVGTGLTELTIGIAQGDVRAAQAGDRKAFGRLYQQYARMVHGILLAHVPYQDAEDLVQNVFTSALENLASLRDSAAVGGWLAALARNAANDYHRRSRSSVELLEGHAMTKSPQVDAMAVLAEIRKLPEAYRETLVLRLVEGMTGPEIAVHTGLTPDSVRVNLSRGMKQLRERLSL